MQQTETTPGTVLSTLQKTLSEHGTLGALRYLNSRTRHRYTGTYLFEPPLLRNHCLFDRENPDVRSMEDLVLRDSYCGKVAESGEPFATENSMTDQRLAGHPARTLMMAYHGFPLRDEVGNCFGSLCHWDVRPRLIPAAEFPVLQAAAPVLARQVLHEIGRTMG